MLALLALRSGSRAEDKPLVIGDVAVPPAALREEMKLAPFYKKHLSAGGVVVMSSEKANDYALKEAASIIHSMLAGRREVLAALVEQKARVVVMAHNEFTTDVPEHSRMTPKDYWDRRARGLGGRVTSCGEENLLGYAGDPYSTENILVHEFGHAIHGVGMRALDSTFDQRLREAYDRALQAGLWKDTYAATSRGEYWAEGVQSWFDTNRQNDAVHNHVNTREELKTYDPELSKLLQEVFGDNDWRYLKPAQRRPPSPHLAGYDAAAAPKFQWPARLAR